MPEPVDLSYQVVVLFDVRELDILHLSIDYALYGGSSKFTLLLVLFLFVFFFVCVNLSMEPSLA